MAIYSTFFIASPDELPAGFPGWKMPLAQPEKRVVTDFFGDKITIETREPLWDDEPGDSTEQEYDVVAIEGDYGDYLEGRLPAFVGRAAHWCSKGITNVEIDPLGEIVDGEPGMVDALFAHPSRGAHLFMFRVPVVNELVRAPRDLGGKWSAEMSQPSYTHSADGTTRLNDDWSLEDALSILEPLAALAERMDAGQRLYLLLEW